MFFRFLAAACAFAAPARFFLIDSSSREPGRNRSRFTGIAKARREKRQRRARK